MHEFGLMQTALDAALAAAVRSGGARIHRIRLRVGDMSGVVPEALESAFAALRPGTPAEDAELEIDRVATLCRCSICKREFTPADVVFFCPHCGQVSTEIRQGHELELASLEVS